MFTAHSIAHQVEIILFRMEIISDIILQMSVTHGLSALYFTMINTAVIF